MKRIRRVLAVAAVSLLLAPWAGAQGPWGGQPPGMGPNGKAGGQWRAAHRNTGALRRTLRGLEMLDQDAKTRLTRAQAKSVVSLLKAWRHKPVMTDAQAKTVDRQLTASLSKAQRVKMAAMPQRGPGGPGGPGWRPGPPDGDRRTPRDGWGGGRPGGGGSPPPGAQAAPRNENPLNPDTQPFAPMRTRGRDRLDHFIHTLALRAR